MNAMAGVARFADGRPALARRRGQAPRVAVGGGCPRTALNMISCPLSAVH
jgi:hypothetical protein